LILRGYKAYLLDGSKKNILTIIATVIGALLVNMAVGFIFGMFVYYLIDKIEKNK
jgi:Na+/citrate or Na+/malate symporter